jgi:hypothetical protein
MASLMTLFLVTGTILAGLSIPLITGIVPPNDWYGFRMRKTITNPEIWYPVNKRSGIWLLATSVCIILAAICLAFIPNITLDVYSLSVTGILVITFTITMVDTIRYMNRL